MGGLLLYALHKFIMSNNGFIEFDQFLTLNALLLKVEGVRYSVSWTDGAPYYCELPVK